MKIKNLIIFLVVTSVIFFATRYTTAVAFTTICMEGQIDGDSCAFDTKVNGSYYGVCLKGICQRLSSVEPTPTATATATDQTNPDINYYDNKAVVATPAALGASCGAGGAGVCQAGSFFCSTSRVWGGTDCASGTICCSTVKFVDPDTGLSTPSGTGPVPDPQGACSGTCRATCTMVEDIAAGPGNSCAAGQHCCVSTGAAGSNNSNAATSAGTGVYIPTAAETGLSGAGIQAILINLLRWLLGIVGVVALIGFAISGVQYILAAGSDEMVTTAKKNMINSIMGIVIVLASLVIVQAIDYALRAQGSF